MQIVSSCRTAVRRTQCVLRLTGVIGVECIVDPLDKVNPPKLALVCGLPPRDYRESAACRPQRVVRLIPRKSAKAVAG